MILHRKGERGAVPFRSGRFFNIDTEWYFSCREGKDLGPFGNREKASCKRHRSKLCKQFQPFKPLKTKGKW